MDEFEDKIPMFPEYMHNWTRDPEELEKISENLKVQHRKRKRETKISSEPGEIKITNVSIIIVCHGSINATFNDEYAETSSALGVEFPVGIELEDNFEETQLRVKETDTHTWFTSRTHELESEYDQDGKSVRVDYTTIDVSDLDVFFSNSGSCAMVPMIRDENFMTKKQALVNDAMDAELTRVVCSTNNELNICKDYGNFNRVDFTENYDREDVEDLDPENLNLTRYAGEKVNILADKIYQTRSDETHSKDGVISDFDFGKIVIILTVSTQTGVYKKKYIILGPELLDELAILVGDFPNCDDDISNYSRSVGRGENAGIRIMNASLVNILNLITSILVEYGEIYTPIHIYDTSCNTFLNKGSSYEITKKTPIGPRIKTIIKKVDEKFRDFGIAYGKQSQKNKKTKNQKTKKPKKPKKNKIFLLIMCILAFVKWIPMMMMMRVLAWPNHYWWS